MILTPDNMTGAPFDSSTRKIGVDMAAIKMASWSINLQVFVYVTAGYHRHLRLCDFGVHP
jgi:hypothetical protein